MKKGKGHGGEAMEFKDVHTVQSGAWEAPHLSYGGNNGIIRQLERECM